MRLGELEAGGVVLGVVLDNALADGGQMEPAVQHVGAEVGVGVARSDGVSEAAHGLEVPAGCVRERANDRLVGCVGATPMAAPG